jgi:hypothetical protein
LVVAIYCGIKHYDYWSDQKAIFDRSGLPAGWVRLCQYNADKMLSDSDDEQTRKEMVDRTNQYRQYVERPPEKAVHCVIRGGWAVNRTDLAVALGTEFAARRRPVYYFTAVKLLEGQSKLERWKELAKLNGMGSDLTATHHYFPKCHIIDDVPNLKFFEQLQDINEAKQLPRVPTKVDAANAYDPRATMQNILYEFYANRDRISTIWVLTCEQSAAERWLKLIRDHACWEKQKDNDGKETDWFGDEPTRAERVIDIDLGAPRVRRAIERGR